MAPLTVPETGLTLLEPPQPTSDDRTQSAPLQIMQLDLADDILQEMSKCARPGGKGVNVTFGKTITLHYGNKLQHLHATPASSHSHLYDSSSSDPSTQLALAGRLSHKLAIQKAKEDTAGADEALAKLQSQLASHEQAKRSLHIHYIPDSSKLPPPVKQTTASRKHPIVKTSSSVSLKNARPHTHLNHDTTRSMPVSPSLGVHAPLGAVSQKTPQLTSKPLLPNREIRLKAIRSPLIHFLAARPASAKLLASHLNARQDDVETVLHKIGKPYRLDQTKWDLTDKTFKELDVWGFEYPNQEDRELAINRTRSAFDRMRISTQDKIWDNLLPKNERGKGKILSQLNLHKGPIQKPTTPKIQIQPSINDSKAERINGDESDQKDRLAPSDAEPMSRSKSHGPIKRTKVSEKEAQSKRLLSNGPKKAAPATKTKETHPAVKKGGAPKKNAPKSSEFVNDSDEEDGLEEMTSDQSQTQLTASSEPSKSTAKIPVSSRATASGSKANGAGKVSQAAEDSKASSTAKTENRKTDNSKSALSDGPSKQSNGKLSVTKPEHHSQKARKSPGPVHTSDKKAGASGASTPAIKSRLSDSSPGSTAMKKSLSRQRTTSSPHKPSPLGSSPPTNASDLDNAGPSSKSSTPLTPPARKVNGITNGISSNTEGRAPKSLKRKADDVDSDKHNHGSSLANGFTDGIVNGHVNDHKNGAKRQKTTEDEPSSDSSVELLARDVAVKKAQHFKKYYANYEKQYQELARTENPPQEKIDEVMKMHRRLTELKDQITRGLVGI